MVQVSRTKKTMVNAVVGICMQIATVIFSFVGRTIFIKFLGEDYLGISGLYTNILSMLSLADMGVFTVMTFSLYRLIVENNIKKIKSYMHFFKKLYTIIACVIFALGIILTFFIEYIVVGSSLDVKDLKLYFILFVANTSASYLIVYKTTLIQADQNVYIIKVLEFLAHALITVLQIVILYLTHNYLLYLIINIAVTLLKNIILSIIADKKYPYLKEKDVKPLFPFEKKDIWKKIKSIFVYRVSAAILNSTDNILISVILGTVIVGYYSNYSLITTQLTALIMVLCQSVLSSVGNLNVTENEDKKNLIFNTLNLVFFVIATFCACCFLTMFNDFISIWLSGYSEKYILRDLDVYAITFTFFVTCISNPIWMYREAAGIFNEVKYIMLITAILNIGLSILFGKLIGLAGIIGATGISRLLTIFWYEPKKLYGIVFKKSTKHYWLMVCKFMIVTILSIALSMFICSFIGRSLILVFVKIIISFVITILMFTIFNIRTKEFKYLLGKFLPKLKNKIFKRESTDNNKTE